MFPDNVTSAQSIPDMFEKYSKRHLRFYRHFFSMFPVRDRAGLQTISLTKNPMRRGQHLKKLSFCFTDCPFAHSCSLGERLISRARGVKLLDRAAERALQPLLASAFMNSPPPTLQFPVTRIDYDQPDESLARRELGQLDERQLNLAPSQVLHTARKPDHKCAQRENLST
jgi:hypothetical protein